MLEGGRFGAAGSRILVEEFLRGRECSLHALLDGKTYRLLPVAQDHKRIGEGGQGANTGGMGSSSPPPLPLDEETERRIHTEIMQPLMRGLAADGLHFQGLLFPGLMLTADGPRCSNSTPASAIPRHRCSCPACGTTCCRCSKR